MKNIRQTVQFKKDLKRYSNNMAKLEKLSELLRLLRNEEKIPSKYKAHLLKGDYNGCMECHVDGDSLLIWLDETTNIISLVRLGSHSEVFGKGAKR